MPILPVLGKFLLKYVLPAGIEAGLSWAWKKWKARRSGG